MQAVPFSRLREKVPEGRMRGALKAFGALKLPSPQPLSRLRERGFEQSFKQSNSQKLQAKATRKSFKQQATSNKQQATSNKQQLQAKRRAGASSQATSTSFKQQLQATASSKATNRSFKQKKRAGASSIAPKPR
ncbi:hypothetical protein [Stenotrophomonas sp. PS02298]|uniref:hypothetical protein n=1 Tax=Stenotrophomonas sp. PS02298 TaxID=2991424 RepID=UPI002499B8E8|nr:hypothetical protein [Stenotrophomonas sp. PS02298]